MKRSPLKRRTPLRSRSRLSCAGKLRRTAIRRVNAAKAKRRRELQFGLQAALCRLLPCSVDGCNYTSEPHHDPMRSMGGLDEDTCPLCQWHHARWHDTDGRRGFIVDTRAAVLAVRELVVWAYDHGYEWSKESTSIAKAVTDEWLRRREGLLVAA